ncbi:sensor histidine kinase [Pseudomonadota bacterium AL_CKDN230030165-1A_HGKHYDSX7]
MPHNALAAEAALHAPSALMALRVVAYVPAPVLAEVEALPLMVQGAFSGAFAALACGACVSFANSRAWPFAWLAVAALAAALFQFSMANDNVAELWPVFDSLAPYVEPAAGVLVVLSLVGLFCSLSGRRICRVPVLPQLALATLALVAMNVSAWWLSDELGQCGLLATIAACVCFLVLFVRQRSRSNVAGLMSATAVAALVNLLPRLDARMLVGYDANLWFLGDTLEARLLSAVVNLTILTLWFRRLGTASALAPQRIAPGTSARPALGTAPSAAMSPNATAPDASAPDAATPDSEDILKRQKIETLSYVGHDLRAPLATIQGYVRLLRESANPPKSEHLDAIERSVAFQLSLIEDVLDYAKAELEPLHLVPVPTRLTELLDEVVPYASMLATATGNRFCFRPPPVLPTSVALDGHRLQQVLLNLLSNAAKFTPHGTIILRLQASPLAERGAWQLCFGVEDDGIGMAPELQDRIFDAFLQLERSRSGVGLGLFIAQRIVENMGGSLQVHSAPGSGSTFSFAIDVDEIDGAPVVASAHPSDETVVTAPFPFAPPPDAPPSPARLELAMLARDGLLSDIEDWLPRTVQAHPGFDAFYDEVRKAVGSLDLQRLETLALHGVMPG